MTLMLNIVVSFHRLVCPLYLVKADSSLLGLLYNMNFFNIWQATTISVGLIWYSTKRRDTLCDTRILCTHAFVCLPKTCLWNEACLCDKICLWDRLSEMWCRPSDYLFQQGHAQLNGRYCVNFSAGVDVVSVCWCVYWCAAVLGFIC